MHTDTREIILTQGQVAIVDAADYEWLTQWKWCADQARVGFYAARKTRTGAVQQKIYMHRVISGATSGIFVDHINHNGLDNRRGNLRLCNQSENARNSRSAKGSSSKYLGVGWEKRRCKWEVQIVLSGKKKWIGYYACEIEAAKAYDAAARLHHGKFANPNFGE